MSSRGALDLPPARLPGSAAALRGEVREFVAGELARGSFAPRCDCWGSAGGWSPAFTRALAARGWVGMTWPARYGGGERSALERYVVTEELLAAGAPVAAHWVADRQTGPALLRFGTEEQRRRFLPAIARGGCSFAIGMSEEGSGSDLASVSTRAERVDGGWRVDGVKKWTGGAHAADFFTVLCRTSPVAEDRHAGLTQLIVDLRSPGIAMRPINLMHGVHQWNEVRLDGVLVPDAMLLGEEGSGWRQVVSELAYERSGPERILSSFPLLAEFAEAARPDDDPRVVATLGSLVARLVALRRLSLSVAVALDEGRAPEVEAALVKDLGTTFERDAVESVRAVRPLLASREVGAVDELLEQGVLAAPGFTLRGGTTEILRGIVARELVQAAGGAAPADGADRADDAPAGGPAASLPEPLGGALHRAGLIAKAAEAILDLTVDHVRSRVRFGRPLARFQAVQQLLALLAGQAVSARAATDAALDALERGDDPELTVALAKARAGEAATEIARIAHQLHGAIGMTDEHPLHRFTRPFWTWRDEFGSEGEWAARAGARVAGAELWARLAPAHQ